MAANKIVSKITIRGLDLKCTWSSESGATFEGGSIDDVALAVKIYDSTFENGGPVGSVGGLKPERGNKLDWVAHLAALGSIVDDCESQDMTGPAFDVPEDAIF